MRHAPLYREARRYSWYTLLMPLPTKVAVEVTTAINLLHAQRALLLQTTATLALHLERLEEWCVENEVEIPRDASGDV